MDGALEERVRCRAGVDLLVVVCRRRQTELRDARDAAPVRLLRPENTWGAHVFVCVCVCVRARVSVCVFVRMRL